jgi:predicted Zn finger-like uncharacterized protein
MSGRMTDPVYTRCPGCATIFRVSVEQLALRDGQVRCGQCRAVFDANNHRLAFDPRRDADVEPGAAAQPDVATGDDDAEPAVAEPGAGKSVSGEPQAAETEAFEQEVAEPEIAEPEDAKPEDAEPEDAKPEPAEPDVVQPEAGVAKVEATELLRGQRFEWRPRKSLRERPKTLYGALIALLVAGIAAQALLEYRNALAAHAAFTRPMLAAACAVANCTVGPLHDAGALSIDASDLQADPAHRGLLKLTATIRNRASHPIAWPYLELTLTDASDNVVARRALAPTEYAGAAADPARGIPGNGEDLLTLFIDASQTSQAGYRLYLFYP